MKKWLEDASLTSGSCFLNTCNEDVRDNDGYKGKRASKWPRKGLGGHWLRSWEDLRGSFEGLKGSLDLMASVGAARASEGVKRVSYGVRKGFRGLRRVLKGSRGSSRGGGLNAMQMPF